MKRFLSLLLLMVMVLSCAAVFSSCKKNGKGPVTEDLAFDLFSDGLLCIERDGKYGYIDKTGTEVIPCAYGYATAFENGTAVVGDGGGSLCFIGTDGARILEDTFVTAYPFDAWDRAVVMRTYTGDVELIDKSGATVFSAKAIEPGNNGYYVFTTGDRKEGMIDKNGEIVLAAAYDELWFVGNVKTKGFDVTCYTDGDRLIARGKSEGESKSTYRLIDYSGKEIFVGDEYTEFESYFVNGRILAARHRDYCIIDRDGKMIAEGMPGSPGDIKLSGGILFDVGERAGKWNDGYVLYDWDGNVVFDFRDSGYKTTRNVSVIGGVLIAESGSDTTKTGVMNEKGEIVVPCEYVIDDGLNGNGCYIARNREGDYTVFDAAGNTVFERSSCSFLQAYQNTLKGQYYVACKLNEDGTAGYEVIDPAGKTVKTFGSEYYETGTGDISLRRFSTCGYYNDGFFVYVDGETRKLVILDDEFEPISDAVYSHIISGNFSLVD